MEVFEVSISVFLLQDIESKDTFSKICGFIDSGMAKVPELLQLHNQNSYKNYCFNSFYPLESDKMYKRGKVYTVKVRTTDKKLAEFFNEKLVNHFNNSMKGLTSAIRIIPRKFIRELYSITPVILKDDGGYWRGKFTLVEFENRLKVNLIKKYNTIMKTKIDEEFQLYTSIEFLNKKPIAFNYKGKKLLGDKISISIGDDKTAQELSYMALGTGILEMNARGAGYMNYKYL